MAPQGSSTLSTRSLKSTPTQTRIPARAPMMTDEVGDTKAHEAVIATSPASIPLQAMVMSGFPKRKYQNTIALAAPATAARLVLTAITEMRRSVAASVEPGLNPIQPNKRMKVPVTTNARLCAGNGLGLPSGPYFPRRGPRMMASAIEQKPPTAWATEDPAKSTQAWPRFIVKPRCDQQTAPQLQPANVGERNPAQKRWHARKDQ